MVTAGRRRVYREHAQGYEKRRQLEIIWGHALAETGKGASCGAGRGKKR